MSTIVNDPKPTRYHHHTIHTLAKQFDISEDKVADLLSVWELSRNVKYRHPVPSHKLPLHPRDKAIFDLGMVDLISGAESVAMALRRGGYENFQVVSPSSNVIVYLRTLETTPKETK